MDAGPAMSVGGPCLLFLVTEDWYFVAHRLALARAARDAGYRVVVATRVGSLADRITAEDFQLEPLRWVRGRLDPLRLALDILAVRRVYRRVRPDIVHHVSLKPIVVGSAAVLSLPQTAVLNALTGLGYAFTSRSVRARLMAAALSSVLRPLLRRANAMTLLENEEDRNFIVEKLGVPPSQAVVNRGSGIDIRHFTELPPPTGDMVTIGCAARMLGIKGIADVVAASRILRSRGVAHRLVLAGAVDRENPDAIAEATLNNWAKEDGVEWLGQIADVRELWRRCDVAVLASRGGEGVPLSLVEAAACGRPLVATDVPGCRAIAQAEFNALLVAPNAPAALADALQRMIEDPALRMKLASASRRVVESGFSSDHIIAATLALYDRMLSRKSRPAAVVGKD